MLFSLWSHCFLATPSPVFNSVSVCLQCSLCTFWWHKLIQKIVTSVHASSVMISTTTTTSSSTPHVCHMSDFCSLLPFILCFCQHPTRCWCKSQTSWVGQKKVIICIINKFTHLSALCQARSILDLANHDALMCLHRKDNETSEPNETKRKWLIDVWWVTADIINHLSGFSG